MINDLTIEQFDKNNNDYPSKKDTSASETIDDGNNSNLYNMRRKNAIIIIAGICITAIFILIVAMTVYIVHQNKVENEKRINQQEKQRIEQIKLKAIERIDYLCDEIYRIDSFYNDSEYEKAKDKLGEVDKLIKENKIEEKKSKYKDAKSYIDDLKTYAFISDNIFSHDISTLKEVDSKISSLTNKKVTSKLSEYYSTLEGHARHIIWSNIAENCQKSVLNESGVSDIKNIYIYDESHGSQSSYAGNVWDSRSLKHTQRYNITAPGVSGRINKNNTYTYFNIQNTTLNPESWNNISSNGRKAVIVEHTRNSKNWVSYWYVGYDVKVTYENKKILYDVTKYSNGTPYRLGKLSFQDVLDIALSISPKVPATNSSLYKVRTSPDNSKSQLGAFANLENAKSIANKNKEQGYKVYDENGNLIYTPSMNPEISATNSRLYKVRTSPNDSKSQLGAFSNLENAKELADKNKSSGYKVYDEQGALIYAP